jgi:hypothetical protein
MFRYRFDRLDVAHATIACAGSGWPENTALAELAVRLAWIDASI